MIDELARAGTETQLVALIRHLDRARFRPFLCLLRGENERSKSLEPAGCTVLRLALRSFRHPATPFKALLLARFLRRQQIDVFQVYFPDSTCFGVPVARLAGVRHVIRTRNNLGHDRTPLRRWLSKFYKRWTDVLVANCEACRRAVLADEGLAPESVVVLENGVDLSRFDDVRPLRAHSGPRRIGLVANLRPVKGLELFVQAAARVCSTHSDVMFQIAGEGELRPQLEQLVKTLNLEERFSLPGSIVDIPKFLAGLDIAVLCSHSEGMSNALLEYMAAGRAIVATAVGANQELIEDGVSGLLVPPGDLGGLVLAIKGSLRDPIWAAQLGAAARRRAFERYSRQAMVRRFEDFYEGLVERVR